MHSFLQSFGQVIQNSAETVPPKLCVSTKSSRQTIRWNFGIIHNGQQNHDCNDIMNNNNTFLIQFCQDKFKYNFPVLFESNTYKNLFLRCFTQSWISLCLPKNRLKEKYRPSLEITFGYRTLHRTSGNVLQSWNFKFTSLWVK